MIKKYYAFVLLLPMAFASSGQDALTTIDSLFSDAQFEIAIAKIDEVLKMTSDRDDRIELENKKAEAYIRVGKYEEAERQLESILSASLTPRQQSLTQCNRGFLFLNQGRNDLALSTLQEAMSNIEKQNRQNSLEAAQILSYLGNLYLATGKYAQAEEQLRMALAIREGLVTENSDLIAASHNDLGLVYSTTDANKALDQYEKAMSIYEGIHGKEHPKIAIANANIGLVYRGLEFYGDAINNFESALAIWEKIYPYAHPTKAFIYFNLGQTYLRMRNEKEAEEFYEKALNTYRESYGKKHPGIATVLNAIGSLKLSSGKFDEAAEYFQHALISNVGNFNETNINYNPIPDNYYSGNTLLYSLLHKAEALEAKYFGKSLKFHEFELALKTLHVCDSLIDDLRQQITNESDKILLGSVATDIYAAGVRISFEAAHVAAKKKSLYESALYFAEKSKSAVLLESISDSNAKTFAGIPSELLDEEKRLKAEVAVLSQKLSLKPGESEEKYLRETKFALNREYQNFVKALEEKFPSYYNLKFNVSTPTLKSLQGKLDEQTSIISYFIDDKNDRLYVFQIFPKAFRAYSKALSKDFDRNVSGLRNSLVYNQVDVYKEAAQKLSAVLIPDKIPTGITNLVVLPTGKLSIIPFETLFYRKLKNENRFDSFPYLLRRYSIQYEFSAAMILQGAGKRMDTVPSIFLCAPVSFEKDGLVSLPGTESEVNSISQIFSSKNLKKEVLTRELADEQIVKKTNLKDFTYLHFATHGIVDEASPELSRIFLKTSSAAEDGSLYAGEIYNLELNAKLVTLSACQTGLGKILKGEGVIGLSRALAYAGSENIIVSFWSVADESTSQLMQQFYIQLLNTPGEDLAVALRQAKLNLMRNDKYGSPYYWGPFVLIGY